MSFGFRAFCVTFAFCVVPTSDAAEPARLSFNKDIRPILSENCFQCHGPDEATREAGMRLDQRDAALKPTDSGVTPIVPGNPDKSDVLLRATSKDPNLMMPPASTHKKLNAAQIAKLRRWIAEGAEYQGHWAWIAPERPAPPAVSNEKWIRNPIDRFVLARLDAEKLKPAEDVDRAKLLRRVTFDLIGLPPTIAELDAFLNDERPDAYERVVDRLLADPRYGEQMAQQWLDYARYADSHGFQSDSGRTMWPWRDWVIDAFNTNMPFDRFTVEQLAGDMLPNATRSQIVATGFNRNNRHNGELGSIPEEWKIENTIDRLETTGTTWLALTYNCCRCHDHKFDPISQKDFYRFFAYFYNTTDSGLIQTKGKNSTPVLAVPTAEQEARLSELRALITQAEATVAQENERLPEAIAAWERTLQKDLESDGSQWTVLNASSVEAKSKSKLVKQADGTYLVSEKAGANETYVVVAPLSGMELTGLLLEAFPDDALPAKSLGRAENGNFVLTRVEAEIASPNAKPIVVEFGKAVADYSQKGWEISHTLSNKKEKGWAVDGNDPTKLVARCAMFLPKSPITLPPDATLTVRLVHESLPKHSIGRFRLSTSSAPLKTLTLEGTRFPEAIQKTLALESAKRSSGQTAELRNFYLATVDSPLKQAENRVNDAKATFEKYNDAVPTVMVMQEGPPRDAFVLKRGEYDKKGEKVGPGLPAMLPPLPVDAPNDRLGLARWIVDPKHPLTSRVWVNRAWEKFFGVGLVKTTENFGSQSEWPSHPELLDWLATEFIRLGWDMKALQKTIVMSATYRQCSKVTPEAYARDPENRLLARGPRFRLSGEMLRDQALFVGGLLVEKIGGPSVRPYMPEGVWDETSKYGDLLNYKADVGDGLYRRTMYTILETDRLAADVDAARRAVA
ncbi:MAG: PSD1 and planctomycete cytochrome C domain-containing protein [Pirellulales bacterium]